MLISSALQPVWIGVRLEPLAWDIQHFPQYGIIIIIIICQTQQHI